MNSQSSQSILATLPSYVGKVAIYKEKMHVWRIRIVKIRSDDTHMFATCETIETHGLNSAGRSWEFATLASDLVRNEYWGARYAGWQIFFSPIVIQKVLDIVSKLPPGKTYLEERTKTPTPSNSKQTSTLESGNCTKELYSYLHNQQFHEL